MQRPDWNQIDKIGYQANKTGIAIQSMTEKQKNLAVIGLVAQINIISGCPIPTDERHLKILENEIIKFLTDHKDFHNLTVEEILNAFRLNAAGKFEEKINHYQNLFNLDYLGSILLKWVPIKRRIEVKAAKEILLKHLFDLPDQCNTSDDHAVEHNREVWIATQDCLQLHVRVFNILTERDQIKLSKEDKERITGLSKVKSYAIERKLYGLFPYEQYENLQRIISRKIAVAECFNGGPIDGFIQPELPTPNYNNNGQCPNGSINHIYI